MSAREAGFAAILSGMFGPAPVDPKTNEEMAWEDDGGPLVARCEGFSHMFSEISNERNSA